MTDEAFTADLGALAVYTDRGIVSKAVYESPGLSVVLFTFDAGQELSEHTASVPAIIHMLLTMLRPKDEPTSPRE